MNTQRKIASFAAGIAGMTLLGISGANAQVNGFSGRWIGSDNSVLTIRGSEWVHQGLGTATIRKGSRGAAIDVYYHQHQGMRCAYRVHTAAGGQILVLEMADALQSPDFCPNGRFSRSD
jgi:hypothetical protein